MKLSTVSIAVAACILVTTVSFVVAQDTTKAKRSFHLRTTQKPDDPDPTSQSIEERTATLRKRMAEAQALLDAGKVVSCLNEFIDPFWLARAAASSGLTVDELLEKQILGDKAHAEGLAVAFARTLQSNLEKEPQWLLHGRVASFIKTRSSHTAEFWIYFEGKWRISPET